MKTLKEYNGYTNYQTWNVALWINNTEGLYRDLVEYANMCKSCKARVSYTGFINYADLAGDYTGDKVCYTSKQLGRRQLTSVLFEDLI